MRDEDPHARLTAMATPCGSERRDLRLGPFDLRLEGLDPELAAELDDRWGPFVAPGPGGGSGIAIAVFDAGERPWLGTPERPDPLYRVEAHGPPARRVVLSRQFALGADPADPRRYRLGLASGPELRGRMIENAARLVAAHLALDREGFALHAAGVLHAGRAYLFAGPSRSGKSTAVAASAPARSLGDDFGLVIHERGRFLAVAVPFDGSERAPLDAVQGAFPVAAIWRLYQAAELRVERPSARVAAASLLSCAAFPWAYPERAAELLEHVQRFVTSFEFAHLHFARTSDLHANIFGGADRAP